MRLSEIMPNVRAGRGRDKGWAVATLVLRRNQRGTPAAPEARGAATSGRGARPTLSRGAARVFPLLLPPKLLFPSLHNKAYTPTPKSEGIDRSLGSFDSS